MHEQAILWICRYLEDTKNQGFTIELSDNWSEDCYADADVAGLWRVEDPNNPNCAKSCTGFVVTVASYPVIWKSKLHQENSLSTLYTECIVLSQAIREFLPSKELVKEILSKYGFETDKVKYFTCSTFFEDNQGTITVAMSPGYTPTSTCIAARYKCF